MYVNYYTRKRMNDSDNPPIGIVLCADKNESLVKFTLPEGENQIFVSKYKTYLPTEEELQKELDESRREFERKLLLDSENEEK